MKIQVWLLLALQCGNPGREEVRGDLVMTFKNKATNEEFNGYLQTPNVVAQRLDTLLSL